MNYLPSYEEFEKEFIEEEKLTLLEQKRIDRIKKAMNIKIRTNHSSSVKKELPKFMDINIPNILIIEILSEMGIIEGNPTNVVYEAYKNMSIKKGCTPMNQISFSQFVIKYFEFEILNKKIKGKKYRVFSKLENEKITEKENKLFSIVNNEWWRK